MNIFSLLKILVVALPLLAALSGCEGDVIVKEVFEPQTPVVETAAQSNNTQQPVERPAPGVADITDLVLVTGQSNALGAGTAFNPQLDQPDRQVFAFTNNGWQVADLRQIWDRGWFPRNNPDTDPSNNLSLHFGKRLTDRDPARVVGFILITAPGAGIDYWQSDGAFFAEIRNKVSRAINELPTKSRLDGILWHQGETDGEDDDLYSQKLYTLIADFRSESWFDFGEPFICGETAGLPVNKQLRKLNRDADIWTACVAAEGLPTRVEDDAHFNAEALRLIGQRYADKYYDMTR